ncbi:hypothetical protein D3C84_729540 [compost metagenome]
MLASFKASIWRSIKIPFVVIESEVFKVDNFEIISGKSFLNKGSPPVNLILSTPFSTKV